MSEYVELTTFGAPLPLMLNVDTGELVELWAWWEWVE